MSKFALSKGWKKVAILTDSKQDYSVGLTEFFKKHFAANGGTITGEQSYSSGDKDFNAQLTAIKAGAPDAIFASGYYNEVALVAKQARDLGITVPLLGGDGWDSASLIEVGGKAMVFANLTVKENLAMGAYLQKDKAWIAKQTDYVFHLFPRLKERENQAAGTMSGGEQQMLAIGRALLSNPKFLMLDEPSLGIAPLLVKAIFERIVEINREQGLTILLVEQNANLALDVSSYGYVLETGKILLEGPSAELKANPRVQEAYLGA